MTDGHYKDGIGPCNTSSICGITHTRKPQPSFVFFYTNITQDTTDNEIPCGISEEPSTMNHNKEFRIHRLHKQKERAK